MSDVRAWPGRMVGPLVASVVSLLAAIQALRLWEWRPGTPVQLGGDATGMSVALGELMSHGRLVENPRLGAPFGHNPTWFPADDQIHYLAVWVLGLFTDSPFTVGAVYFVIGFPLAALTAYWLFREFGTTRTGAVVGSVLFSVLPGHQTQFEHLWLAGYWVVPLGVWLVLQVGRGRPLWLTPSDPLGATRRSRRLHNARTTLIAICVAIGGVYYLAFTLIMLAAVVAVRAATGERRRLVGAVALAVAMMAMAGVAIASSSHGHASDLVTGPTPGQRSPGESEVFAGRFMDLVLPWHEHRVAALRFLTSAYDVGTEATPEHPALGLVALVGVVGLLWRAFRGLATGDPMKPARLTLVAALTVLALALFTRGGLGSFIALFVTPQIRTWSRVVVLIGLFGLLAVAYAITVLQRRRSRAVAIAVGVLVLGLGVLDQTSPGAAPDYSALRQRVALTQDFTRTLESAVGKGCSIFQLPVVEYPETPPPGDMKDYDHLMPYLTQNSLRWSYGAMRGTARGDWQLAVPHEGSADMAEKLAAAGFCGVEVDTAGYVGKPSPVASLRSVLGEPVSSTTDGRLVAFDLAPARLRVVDRVGSAGVAELGQQVLHPVIARVGGFPVEVRDGVETQWIGPRSPITIGNLTDRTISGARLTVELAQPADHEWPVTVTVAGQPDQHVVVPAGGTRQVEVTVDLPSGTTSVSLRSNVDDARQLSDGKTVSGQVRAVSLTTPDSDVIVAVVRPPSDG